MDRFANRTLIRTSAGAAISLSVHLIVIVPVFSAAMTSPGEQVDRKRGFKDAAIEQPTAPEEQSNDIPLGVEGGDPSSLTWIGYDKYVEHLAMLAPVEQAAFDDDPIAPAPVPTPAELASASAPPPVPEVTETVEADLNGDRDQSDERTTTAVVDPVVIADPRAQQAPESASPMTTARTPLPDLLARVLESLARQATIETTQADTDQPADVEKDTKVAISGPTRPEKPKPDPSTTTAQKATDAEGPVTESETESTDSETAEAPPTQSGSPDRGTNADRESDPTSRVDVPFNKIKIGQPLAADGLEVRTRAPSYTDLQSLKLVPNNPLVVIRFGRDGKPRDAAILETSLSRSFDNAILPSLYRWRASGEQLKELRGEETIDIEFRLILR